MATRPSSPDNEHSRERGETLVEVLAAVIILGIAAVAVLAAVQLTVKSSDLGRKQANGGSYVRSLAEAVQNDVVKNGYQTCGGSGYLTPSVKTNAGLPATYTATASSSVWNGTAWVGCTSALDKGVQRLELTVVSPDGPTDPHRAVEKLVVVLRRPCSGALPDPC